MHLLKIIFGKDGGGGSGLADGYIKFWLALAKPCLIGPISVTCVTALYPFGFSGGYLEKSPDLEEFVP
jgi:hypothetical protein